MVTSPVWTFPPRVDQVRGVCLDVDDTLVDSSWSLRQAVAELVDDDVAWPMWLRTTEKHYQRYIGGEIGFDAMRLGRTQDFFAAFGEYLDEMEAQRRERIRVDAMRRAWTVFDDVWPCLDWLHAVDIKTAVITNAPSAYQRDKIASVGLASYFDEIVISEEMGTAKPDPAIFEGACEALGLPTDEVIHVGDRLDVDALGACDAGLHGVWLDRRGESAMTSYDGLTITGLSELPELLVCDLPPRAPALGEGVDVGAGHGVV